MGIVAYTAPMDMQTLAAFGEFVGGIGGVVAANEGTWRVSYRGVRDCGSLPEMEECLVQRAEAESGGEQGGGQP